MRFLIERSLFEGVKETIQRYPNIKEEDAIQIIKADPTANVDSDVAGKYSKWLLNLYNNKKLKLEDLYKATEYLTVFDKKKNKFEIKDIMQYKSLPDLAEAVEEVSAMGNTAQDNKRDAHKAHKDLASHATLLWSDGTWEMWTPKDYQGSCALGRNSHWCTASTESDHEYNYYLDEYGGKYIIFLNKNNDDEKYQLHFESGQFMDRLDGKVDMNRFFNAHNNLKQALLQKEILPNINQYLDIQVDSSKLLEVPFSEHDVHEMIEGKKFVSHSRSGRDDITGEDLVSMLDNPWDYFESSSAYSGEVEYVDVDFDEEVYKLLKVLGINDNHDLKDCINDNSDNEYADEIKDAYSRAYWDAIDIGAQDEFFNDVEYTLNTNIKDFVKENPSFKLKPQDNEPLLNGFTMVVGNDEKDSSNAQVFTQYMQRFYEIQKDYYGDPDYFIDEYDNPFHSTYDKSYSDGIKAYIAEGIMKEFSVSKPRYGWQGFNEDVFTSEFEEEIYSIAKGVGKV